MQIGEDLLQIFRSLFHGQQSLLSVIHFWFDKLHDAQVQDM